MGHHLVERSQPQYRRLSGYSQIGANLSGGFGVAGSISGRCRRINTLMPGLMRTTYGDFVYA